MLTYLNLINFKSFSNILFDLRRAHGEPKRFAFVYGENGSGKSNLMSSLLFLSQSLNTLDNQNKLKDISEINNRLISSIEDEKTRRDILNQVLRSQCFKLSDLIEDYKMIGTEEPMSLKFGFRINGADGSYSIKFSECEIIQEELRYKINEREGVFFSIQKNKKILSPTIFSDSAYKKELSDNIEKYWGKHSFMSILTNEISNKNYQYVKSKLDKSIFNVIDWLSRLSVWCKECKGETARITIPFDFMRQLDHGNVKSRDDEELKNFEIALNTFFTHLYSDIKASYYVFTPENDGFSYELYFKKLIDGRLIEIPVSLESTGTQKLLAIFPMLFTSFTGASVFIDEIDSGIHDLLMQNLFEHLEDSLVGQFIATTHNTLLMESLPNENTYVISIDSYGNKSIDCVSNYTDRTQKTNNIRKKYLRGDYYGVPNIGYFDFQELVEGVLGNSHPLLQTKDGEDA